MFNDCNETSLIPHNEFHLGKEKKQENVPKWSYGQPSLSFFSNRSSELWCGKPNYNEISNNSNISPKCNCSGCYSSKSYQSDSTHLKSWLPKSFSVPKSNSIESCKLPEQNQWNNVGLPNQSSCFSENNIQTPQCVQAGGEKHPYYRQFSNARVSESNQPGVIITAKKSEYAKEDFLPKHKGFSEAGHEVAFYGQNCVRQSVFCSAAYNLAKNSDKRIESQNCSSNFRDLNEKFSALDSYGCPVNSIASTTDQSKLSVVEPFIKAVPSDNQNRVPLSGDRNFKENVSQSVMYQNCDSKKNISLDPCAVFGTEKNSRTLYQLRLEKEGIEHFHAGQTMHNVPLPATIETKNSDIYLSHQMYINNNNSYDDNNRDISLSQGSFLEDEGQGMFENIRSEFCHRNSYSDNINKVKQPSVIDLKKDCVINSIGQVNFSDLRCGDLSRSSGPLENHKHSEMFFIKDYNTEKVYKQDILGQLQQNPNFFQNNENLVQNKNSSFQNLMWAPSLTPNDPRDSCFGEKTLLPCPYLSAETDFRNPMRPNFSHQGYNSQDRYKNPTGTYVISGLQRNEFNSYHSNPLQQAAPNFGGIDRQSRPKTNASFIFNPHLQQLGHSEGVEQQQHHSHKNSSCDLIQKNPTVPQNNCENFISRPLDIMKNSHLETIRSENVNKNKSNKISPLRLLRKKKLVPHLNDDASGSPALVSSSVTAPVLDVRRFWSTWAEEEEENIGPTQMVVLDCQNIGPEEAKLLQFYESNPVRDFHEENNDSIQISKDSECVASHMTLPVHVSAGEVLTSMESSAIELKSEHSTTKSVFENRNEATEKEEIVEKADSAGREIENVSPNVSLVEERNRENSKNHSLNVGSYVEKKILESNPSDLTCQRIDTRLSRKTKQNGSQDNKEIIRNKKINLKAKSDSPPDKWTEKKLEFLKRAEESKAAEILRHKEEKKKIFERRLSFKKENVYDGVNTMKINSIKCNSDSEAGKKIFSIELSSKNILCEDQNKTVNKISKKLSLDENFRSQLPNSESSTISDLPTSEYRRNKFLDYSEQKTIFNCVVSDEKYNKNLENVWTYNEEVKNELQLSEKSSVTDNESNLLQEYSNNSNHFNSEKLMKNELGSLDLKNVKKTHEIDVQSKFENTTKNSCEDKETKPKISDKMKILSNTKKISRNKKVKLKESDENSEKVTVENISSSKPTIKFSIQKSHDLKISFKVLNGANKKLENLNNEDKTGKKETERQKNVVDNSTNSAECITLKLKSINRDHSNHGKLKKLSKKVPVSRHLDSAKKYKRRIKRKRLNEKLFKVVDNKNCTAKKEVPLIHDTIYENCLKPSKNSLVDDSAISENFQVREKIDSAKIKLTFKRNRLNNRKFYENNKLSKEKNTIENSKPEYRVLVTEDSQPKLKIEEKPEIFHEPCALSIKSEPRSCEAICYADSCSKCDPKGNDLNLTTEENQHHLYASFEPLSDANHKKLLGENKTLQKLSANSKLPISPQIHSDLDYNTEEEQPQRKKFNWDESLVKPVTCTKGTIRRFTDKLPKSENTSEQTHDYKEKVDFGQKALFCEDNVSTEADILITSKKSLEPEHFNKEGSKENVPLKSNNNFLVKYSNESIQSNFLRGTTPVKSNLDILFTGNKNIILTDPLTEISFEEERLTNSCNNQSYEAPLGHNRNITMKETNKLENNENNMGKKIEYELDSDNYCCKNKVHTPRPISNDDKNERVDFTKINEDTDFDHYQTNLVQNFANNTLATAKTGDSHTNMMVNSQSEEAYVLESKFCSTNQNADFTKKNEMTMSSVEMCNNQTLVTNAQSMILSESTENTSDLIFHPQNQTSMVEETFSTLVLDEKMKDVGDCVGNTENTGSISQLSMCEAPDKAFTVFSTEDSKRPTTHLLSPECTQYKLDEQVLEVDKSDLFVASSTSSSVIFNKSFNYNSCFESTENNKSKTFFEIENENWEKIDDHGGDDLLSSLVKGNLLENRSSNVREVNLNENESNKECANISKELDEINITLHSENCNKAEKPFSSGFEICFQNSIFSSKCITKENDLHALSILKNSENLFSPSILQSKKSTCANKVKRRFSFEAGVLKKKKVGKTNLKKGTAQNAFTHSRWNSPYTRAHSINLVERANLVVPILDIPVKDIPLPLGNPPPENCFDLERYFKLPTLEEKTESLLTKTAVDLEKRADCLTEANRCSKKRLVVKNCHSPLEKKSIASHENLSPSQKDKRHQNSSKFFPLSKDEKKIKVKFSLAKPKSLKSILWGTVNKNNSYPKNKQKCSVFQSDLKEELSSFLRKINLDSNSNLKSFDTNLKMSVYSENLEKKPKTDISKKSAAISSEILTSAVRKTLSECPIISTYNVQDEETKLEKSRYESLSTEMLTNELPNGFDGESAQKKIEAESIYCEEMKALGTEIVKTVQDVPATVNFVKEQRNFIEEFYKCEDIPTSEDLPHDVEVSKVSDDDIFRNIMQNCIDNAKKFFSVKNLKLFSYSVDDFLELNCQLPEPMTDESRPEKSVSVSTNHISRDVLLSSCEETINDDLELSEKYHLEDMPMEFVPSFCSESSHNLCPEILPVENWPYLEEEVPASPSKLKSEETDFISKLENFNGAETTKYKNLSVNSIRKTIENFDWNRASEILFPDSKKFKRYRRRSFMSDGETYRKCSILTLERRKTTDGSSSGYSLCQKSSEKISGLKDEVREIESNRIIQSFKCRLSLDKISKNNCDNKTTNHSFFCKSRENKFTKDFRSKSVGHSASNYSVSLKYTDSNSCKKRKSCNYKSPVWQPKVVLFRISKQELRRFCRSSHYSPSKVHNSCDGYTESNSKNKINNKNFSLKQMNMENNLTSIKSDSNVNVIKPDDTEKIRITHKVNERSTSVSGVDPPKKRHAECLNVEMNVPNIDGKNTSVSDTTISSGFAENLKETIKGLLNSGTSKVFKFRKRKKRFRNLHTKEKSDYNIKNSARALNFSAEKTKSENGHFVKEGISEDVDLPKEREFNSDNKSTKKLTDVKCKGSREKSAEISNPSHLPSSSKKIEVSSTSISDKKSIPSCVGDKKTMHSSNIIKKRLYKSKSEKLNKIFSGSCKEKRKNSSSKCSHRDRREENKWKSHNNHKSNFNQKEVFKSGEKNSDINRNDQKISKITARHERNNDPQYFSKETNNFSESDSKLEELECREPSLECPWVCEVCGFHDATKRVAHIVSHPFHCQSCHLAFKTEARFVIHLTKKHKDIRNQHHCLLCEMSFDTEDQYRRHLETREHRHLESVEKNTINTLFTLLTGEPCPVLGFVEMKPEWLPNQAGTVHFYHQATPLSLALQYLKMHHDLSSFTSLSSSNHSN